MSNQVSSVSQPRPVGGVPNNKRKREEEDNAGSMLPFKPADPPARPVLLNCFSCGRSLAATCEICEFRFGSMQCRRRCPTLEAVQCLQCDVVFHECCFEAWMNFSNGNCPLQSLRIHRCEFRPFRR